MPLELCFTSDLQTKAVANPECYPINRFLAEGITVTVNTDNMTVSGTNLLTEYRALETHFGLSQATLMQLALNSAEAAFVSAQEKNTLKAQIREAFSSWYN